MARSTAPLFSTGSTPGKAMSTAEAWLFGGAPKAVEAAEKIFDAVESCVWVSSPMTVSHFIATILEWRQGDPEKSGGFSRSLVFPCSIERYRHAPVPVGHPLVLMGDAEDARLAKMIPLNQHADGKAFFVESARNRNSRSARQVAGDGEDIVQVHLDRVVGLVADRKRGRRRCRADDDVAAFVDALEILGNQPPHLLRLEVVRIVIAMREHVGADQDPTLDLGAETFGPRLLVHVEQVGILLRTVTIAHAVETRQVRRRFRRRDDVIDRNRQLDVGQTQVDRCRAELGELDERLFDGAKNSGFGAFAEIFLR